MTEFQMYKESFKRPKNYFELSSQEQWDLDKNLGIEDWEGCNMTFAQQQRYWAHYDAIPANTNGNKDSYMTVNIDSIRSIGTALGLGPVTRDPFPFEGSGSTWKSLEFEGLGGQLFRFHTNMIYEELLTEMGKALMLIGKMQKCIE